MRKLWERFLDWLTGRRISDIFIHAIGQVHGPVRHVYRFRDQFIVMTDYDVYAVYFDGNYGHMECRRMR